MYITVLMKINLCVRNHMCVLTTCIQKQTCSKFLTCEEIQDMCSANIQTKNGLSPGEMLQNITLDRFFKMTQITTHTQISRFSYPPLNVCLPKCSFFTSHLLSCPHSLQFTVLTMLSVSIVFILTNTDFRLSAPQYVTSFTFLILFFFEFKIYIS